MDAKLYYSVVVPAHNEGGNLAKLVSRLAETLRKQKKPFEILIVNDNSSDNSLTVLDELKKRYRELTYLNRTTQAGVGNAKRDGFKTARGKFIITMDGDLSHDPRELPMLLEKSESCDVVCGSRHVAGAHAAQPLSRKVISNAFNFLFRLLIGIRIKDITSGYRVINRKVLDTITLECKGFGIYIEIPLKAYIAGFKICEVPITYHKREYGKSNLSYLKQGPEYLRVGIAAFIQKMKLLFTGDNA